MILTITRVYSLKTTPRPNTQTRKQALILTSKTFANDLALYSNIEREQSKVMVRKMRKANFCELSHKAPTGEKCVKKVLK